jgi:hypothetical protein
VDASHHPQQRWGLQLSHTGFRCLSGIRLAQAARRVGLTPASGQLGDLSAQAIVHCVHSFQAPITPGGSSFRAPKPRFSGLKTLKRVEDPRWCHRFLDGCVILPMPRYFRHACLPLGLRPADSSALGSGHVYLRVLVCITPGMMI